ncbi:MAG: hypothetical protein ABII10_00665 [Candidatus Paceibacterota bacterium]
MPKQVYASANGKIIFSGEHAGVYGYPMIAGPINKTITVSIREGQIVNHDDLFLKLLSIFSQEFRLELKKLKKLDYQITSDLPSKSGLGSSAAYSKALFSALANYFSLTVSKQQLFELIQRSETIFHGNPSGVDAAVVVFNKYLYFQKQNKTYCYESLNQQAQKILSVTPLYAIYSGAADESTKEMVSLVAEALQAQPKKKDLLEKIGKLTEKSGEFLEDGVFPFALIQENHLLLEELGVVGEKAQVMIQAIQTAGAVAKITGAGGIKNGSGYLLAAHQDPAFEDFLKSKKWQYFKVFN